MDESLKLTILKLSFFTQNTNHFLHHSLNQPKPLPPNTILTSCVNITHTYGLAFFRAFLVPTQIPFPYIGVQANLKNNPLYNIPLLTKSLVWTLANHFNILANPSRFHMYTPSPKPGCQTYSRNKCHICPIIYSPFTFHDIKLLKQNLTCTLSLVIYQISSFSPAFYIDQSKTSHSEHIDNYHGTVKFEQ